MQTNGQIIDFNRDVLLSEKYVKRRHVQTTKTIFYDDDAHSYHAFASSAEGWCTIPNVLASFMTEQRDHHAAITCDDWLDCVNSQSEEALAEARGAEIRKYLGLLASLYVACYSQRIERSYNLHKEDLRAKLEWIRSEVDPNPEAFASTKASIVGYIRNGLKVENRPPPRLIPAPGRLVIAHKAMNDEVLDLRRKGNYSVKDICAICKLTPSKYYRICRESDQAEEHKGEAKVPRGAWPRLSGSNLIYLKGLADDPFHSYTAREMRNRLWEALDVTVSTKTVYYHLTRTLGYSYKRSRFKPAAYFGKLQKSNNYKVAKAILDFNSTDKNIICIDESGFQLGIQREYSYAKKGDHAFRAVSQSPIRVNLIMAITARNILAYQLRRGNHNEHSFMAFIIDLAAKICLMGHFYASNTVLFLDNASFHRSALCMRLYRLLPFRVLFNAPYMCDLNPIESVFSIVKRTLKEENHLGMYALGILLLTF